MNSDSLAWLTSCFWKLVLSNRIIKYSPKLNLGWAVPYKASTYQTHVNEWRRGPVL